MQQSKANEAIPVCELWQKSRLYVTDQFLQPPVVLRVDDSIIGTLGNFSASTGKAKSKKTFNICAIVASALTNGTVLNYRSDFPHAKRKVLYVDTEQSPFHCQRVLKRILSLADLSTEKQPDALEFLCLRGSDPKTRLSIIEYAIYNIPHLGLVIIDGIRDLVYDINSPSESTSLITKLMQWTDERQIHIHTVLQVTKDDMDKDISSVASMYIRDRDFEPFAFRINEDSLPELIENDQPQQPLNKKAFDYKEVSEAKHREALEAVFSIGESLSYASLIDRLRLCYTDAGYAFGVSKAKQLKQFLTNKRMVTQGEDKQYRYNPNFYY
ncbi:AAA domain-containing protein [Dysgonomonas alginatilytica]|uniref:AAA domain-containing protein n=1 Tax=Dysgonomonas alginatilytica TaxID=1605892 RepID=A0A2V3PQW0_9BACT|nr:AAA family ATPase [Dysgonomonas alginatilytica]PXV59976.1 AAA domain-containing protein [Dysgonomonas alginatilytica]